MTGIITDTKIIINLIKKYYPELEKLIDEEYMTIKNFINKWIITIFTNDFQRELGYLIWDFLLLQGDIILFKGIFSIISILKKPILEKNKKEECLYPIFAETLNIDPKNKKLLFGLAIKNYDDLNEKYLNSQRNKINPKVFDNIININKNSYNRKIKMKTILNNKCDEKWPICLGNDKLRINPINKLNYIIFKIPNKTEYYNNYFYDEINNNIFKRKNIENNNCNNIINENNKKNEENFDDLYNIITERENHNCCSLSNKELHKKIN